MMSDISLNPLFVDSKTLQEMLPCIGRSKFYELIHEPGFPKIAIGRKFIYDPERVREYLSSRQDEGIR